MLKELGFESCETVKKCEEIVQRNKEKEEINEKYLSQLKTIKELKQKYPFEVFTTLKEFESICEKYNLIYAPAKNYVKDIPEKNVLEIANAKKLSYDFIAKDKYKLIPKKGGEKRFQAFLNAINKSDGIFDKDEHKELLKKYADREYCSWSIYEDVWAYVIWKEIGEIGFYTFSNVEHISIQELHIAAPKSHFNLDDVKKTSKFGFSMATVKEVKDPIAFEFCCNDIIRIISKWGTPDDQSYLDERLVNENLN